MGMIIEIADAVVAELASGEFSTVFTPQRLLAPVFDLAEMSDLQVTVVPKSIDISASSRVSSNYDVEIDIGVQKKVADIETEVAELCGFVEELAAFLRRRPLQGAQYAAWKSTENKPIYSVEHLHDKRTFTSILTLTYRVMA